MWITVNDCCLPHLSSHDLFFLHCLLKRKETYKFFILLHLHYMEFIRRNFYTFNVIILVMYGVQCTSLCETCYTEIYRSIFNKRKIMHEYVCLVYMQWAHNFLYRAFLCLILSTSEGIIAYMHTF